MPARARLAVVCALAALSVSDAIAGIAVPTIWSGPDIVFAKANKADPLLPGNQDFLTENVRFTRGDIQGLLNAVTECDEFSCAFTHSFSPQDTEWATDLIEENDGITITAANWNQLE